MRLRGGGEEIWRAGKFGYSRIGYVVGWWDSDGDC